MLILRNLGKVKKIKQRLRENGDYWGEGVDLYQTFEREINKWGKVGKIMVK